MTKDLLFGNRQQQLPHYLAGYSRGGAAGIQHGRQLVDIDADAVKNYQLKHGLYSKEELAAMSTDEIKQLDTKKQVYLTATIRILDAMEDIHLDVTI